MNFRLLLNELAEKTEANIKMEKPWLSLDDLSCSTLKDNELLGQFEYRQKENPSEQNIIRIFMSETHPYSINVLFHEVAHLTGIGRILNRRTLEGYSWYNFSDRAIEEIVAETTAMRLMAHFGLATEWTSTRSKSYIEYWKKHINTYDYDFTHKNCIEPEIDKAVSFILLNWLNHCPVNEQVLTERLQEFNKFF